MDCSLGERMTGNYTSRFRELTKNWIFWLIIITGLAIIIRSIPAWIYAAWGCDFGIYFGITENIAKSGVLFPPYTGWGGSYNEFPVLYAINAFASWISGIDIIDLMPKLTPIFGGLSVLIFYFVVNELTNNKKLSLLFTLLLSVMPFHVYQTSHASPLTMGHFFIMLSMFLFLKYRKYTLYIIPLMISTILLIMSHHLSTYFYLISLIGVVFFENASVNEFTSTFKKDVLYIFTVSTTMFIYWAFVAKTVYNSFMRSGLSIFGIRIESIFIIIIFYILLAFLFTYGVKLIRKMNNYVLKLKENKKNPSIKIFSSIIWQIYPFVKKSWPSLRSRITRFLLIFFILIGLMLYFSIAQVPGLGFSFTILSIFYSLPLVVAIAFGVAGFRYTWYMKNGLFIRGWTFAITLSLLYTFIADNTIILAHRHPEYLMAPLSILTVIGIGGIFSDPFYAGLFFNLKNKANLFADKTFRKIIFLQKSRIVQLIVISVLVVSLTSTTYIVHKSLGASDESITNEDMAVIDWMFLNLDANTSMIASDHRLARMIEAKGFNTTMDETVNIWEAENLSEYIDELIGIGKNHSRITHIIIDDIMKNDVVHVKFGVSKYITNETWTAAYDKFKKQPFELIYRNETLQIDTNTLEPVHWAEVYMVNRTYLESIILN